MDSLLLEEGSAYSNLLRQVNRLFLAEQATDTRTNTYEHITLLVYEPGS